MGKNGISDVELRGIGLGDSVGGRDARLDGARDEAGGSGKRFSGEGGAPDHQLGRYIGVPPNGQ